MHVNIKPFLSKVSRHRGKDPSLQIAKLHHDGPLPPLHRQQHCKHSLPDPVVSDEMIATWHCLMQQCGDNFWKLSVERQTEFAKVCLTSRCLTTDMFAKMIWWLESYFWKFCQLTDWHASVDIIERMEKSRTKNKKNKKKHQKSQIHKFCQLTDWDASAGSSERRERRKSLKEKRSKS